MGATENLLTPEVGSVFFGDFASLRPVQRAAIESLCAGNDAVISSATGSGKTEAVVAPLVSRFRVTAIREAATFLVYVCPTKALINDLNRRLKPPLDRLGLRIAVRHGDRNEVDTSQPTHVIVTTPESLGILLLKQHPALLTVRAVVFDEVHLLYNNQRGQMAAILLHRLRQITQQPLQVAVLSATMGKLEDIRAFILGGTSNAELLSFPANRTIDGDIRTIASLGQIRSLVERLMEVPRRKLLVFANSRRETEALSAALKASASLEKLVVTHHSSLSSEVREHVERWFEGSDRAVCVSTSTLEMGIDIGDIDAVILYGPPPSIESLLQRIGRGNRREMKTNAICLSRDGEKSIRESAIFATLLSAAAKGRMPSQAPFELYGALAQQCLSIILQQEGAYTRIADICEKIGYRPNIPRTTIEAILAELADKEFIQHHGFKNRYGASHRLWDLRDKNFIWGNFPIAGQTIDLVASGRLLGAIPRVNLLRLARGATFRFGGIRYKVANLVEQELLVEACPGRGNDVPVMFAQSGPGGLEAFVADALWDWIFTASKESSFMLPEAWKPIGRILAAVRETVRPDSLPLVQERNGIRYFTFAGITVNRVILEWLGLDTSAADDLSISVPKAPNWKELPTTCRALKDAAERCFVSSERQTIYQQQLPLELQRAEWMEAWLKDADAERVLARLSASGRATVSPELMTPFLAS